MTMTFKCADKDRFLTLISAGITLVLSLVAMLILYLTTTQPPGEEPLIGIALGGGTCLAIGGTLGICFAYSLRSFALDTDRNELTITRLVGRKVIPLKPPLSARAVDKTELRRMIHTWGNGGLFSYQGEFQNGALGSFRLYSSNLRKNVLIAAAPTPILVSPEDTQGFIAAIQSMNRTGS